MIKLLEFVTKELIYAIITWIITSELIYIIYIYVQSKTNRYNKFDLFMIKGSIFGIVAVFIECLYYYLFITLALISGFLLLTLVIYLNLELGKWIGKYNRDNQNYKEVKKDGRKPKTQHRSRD